MVTEDEARWFEGLFKQSTLTKSDKRRLTRMVLDERLCENDILILEARFPAIFAVHRRRFRNNLAAAGALILALAIGVIYRAFQP